MFPWAHFRKTKSAIKMHTMINLQGKIPDFILISMGKTADVQVMDVIEWEAGSWYAMDRGYLDFERLYRIHQCGAFFVTRSKTNTQYERVYSNPVDKSTGVLCDQRVRLTGTSATKDYPEMIRRVRYIDKETGKSLTFLTNNMLVPAETVALLYKNRWHVELFFKWIKQHLRVKRFFGQSENAVKSQLWIAVCVYTLISLLKARFSLSQSDYEILQILSITVFEKTPVFTLFAGENYTSDTCNNSKQLTLFDL
jgi:IS4 transposase